MDMSCNIQNNTNHTTTDSISLEIWEVIDDDDDYYYLDLQYT
jgi:hypothetical protein